MKRWILTLTLLLYMLFVVSLTLYADVIVIRSKAGQQVALYKNSYALVVGVSDYTNGWA